jgi:hypothetical protein
MKIIVILLVLVSFFQQAISQNTEKKKAYTFGSVFTVTTKGMSTFPNLTLGKPAAIFDFSIGDDKFRFEPTLRFGLDGKPWSFIFWLRYDLVKSDKFQFRMGAHPAFSFKTINITDNGVSSEIIRTQQFLAGELSPVFNITRNISISPYYLYANGVTPGAVKNSNFISLRTNFSRIGLSEKYFMRLMAQAYYLQMDANDGYYVNSTLSLNRQNFPLSISTTMNEKLKSSIAGDDFLWNISLSYSFGGKYTKL